jgi:hypothetical protein
MNPKNYKKEMRQYYEDVELLKKALDAQIASTCRKSFPYATRPELKTLDEKIAFFRKMPKSYYNYYLEDIYGLANSIIDEQLSLLQTKPEIKACDVPKIDGLGEALDACEVKYTNPINIDGVKINMGIILQAARAYHKQMGGE